ncbi:hypothetical protein So717_36440 [Roseobacter cerasinus]|uniref:Phospholipid/glycerol acyltransferase domain-containing protein n=1 Tax=Roseobacter cerasinus TaxID=2602289 RepID=A0A640VXR7_9RHOB|nr:1-acyl-sn-glycerol-3-phosphate acyltransferase [Roseobacter cerasinus]GFE51891.1 hypothetical protein So717_36440 [Roseobacter cerasinus]
MLAPSSIPDVGNESRIIRQAHAAVFRMLLSYLDRKLETHLKYFAGSEHIPRTGPVIIVPNHQSYFDGFAITALVWKLTGRKVRIPTNIKALTNPLVAFLQVAGGAVPIDPAAKADTYARMTALLQRGEAVVIYPEGTRSDGTMLHPFRYGAFNLAVDLGVPILPVTVRNFANVLPKGSLRFKAGETGSIVFGAPIDPRSQRFAGADPQEVARRICDEVRGWIHSTAFRTVSDQEVAQQVSAEVSAVARRADDDLEDLLDQGAELITRQDAARVLQITSAKNILRQTNFDLDLQELRAVGFRVGDLPLYRAVFELGYYKTLLEAALAQDGTHAYLNYCAGLLQLRLPRLLGGGDPLAAVRYFETAYETAETYGYPKARFVHGYAKALAGQGETASALSLLQTTFDGTQSISGVRALRRRERGLALMTKLQQTDTTTATPPTRPLRGFELVMAQTRISDIIVAQIDGIFDFAQVFDAASALQQRHPGLRARVVWPEGRDKRPVFEYQPADQTRLHVREERPAQGRDAEARPFWEEVAEREVNHLFDLSEGYMFRLTWLPESGHVILNAQHAVIDGVSLMRLLHDFARHCAGEDLGPDLPPTEAALVSAPKVNLLEKIVGLIHRESFIRARTRFAEWSTLPIAGRLKKGAQMVTDCHFHDGDPANFDKITAACRAQGVTVGGAYAAAIQCAMLHFSKSSFGPKEKYYVPMDFSLRRFIPGGDRAQESVGLFSGVSPVIFNGDPSASFWELARSFMEASRAEIDTKSPLIFHQVFDRFFNLERAYDKYNLHCVDGGGVGGPLTMSNVGKFPFDPQVGPVRIRSLHGMSASQKGGAMLYFWLRSVNGRFFYSGTSVNPAADRDFAAEFFAFVVFLMENCVSAAAQDKAIREYIPEAASLHQAAQLTAERQRPQLETVA